MMFISEIDAAVLVQSAVRQTASRLRIDDVEWKNIDELLEEIALRDQDAHESLQDFLKAYMAWFEFHQKVDRQGKAGRLDAREQAELTRLIDNRNRARAAILQQLATLV
ncbi:hypothetical protein BE08_08310 [Sorangium cellulosum]|uniref:Uncharacterized protein n=1 Tax=Sorangium cellulosum TaxID=56 RepID=A0A150P6W0_SORCE|nr:hypothetical protein BE08_08310 [Sorangium cellulosum]